MSVIADFDNIIANAEAACDAAINGGLRDGLLRKIKEKAEQNVYSYGASGWAMSSRRGMIGDVGNMEIETGGGGNNFYLRITNVTQLQHPGGADESDVVEGGWSNYRQPGPREFMNPALDEFVGSGEADSILRQYFSMYGII